MRSVEKKIYLGILVCVLVSMIGVSFAYFTTGITFGGNGGATNLSTPNDLIHVAYDAGSSSLVLENAIPGTASAKKAKTFTVTVTPSEKQKSVKYAIELIVDESTNPFTRCTAQTSTNACKIGAKELTYTLKEGTQVIKTGDLLDLNSGANVLGEISKTVETSTPFTYTLEIEYLDTGADQNHNMNKSFSGSVKVLFAE